MTVMHLVVPGAKSDTVSDRVPAAGTADGKLLVQVEGLDVGEIEIDAEAVGAAVGDNLRGGEKLPANILMGLGGAKRVAAESSSARVQLATSGIVGVSITAVGAAIRYELGNASVDASATSHYLPEGQSRDFRVATSQYIAAIRAGSTDGVLEITELAA